MKKETKHQWLERTIAMLANEDRTLPWQNFPCVLWPFAQRGKQWRDGTSYGVVSHLGKLRGANREAWSLAYGEIPDDLQALHYCDVRPCIRPVHLFLGTTADNLRDCSAKGRMHPGERNPGAKLTEDEVREARVRLAAGESQRSIARSFGIHYNAIWKIAHNLKWRLTV